MCFLLMCFLLINWSKINQPLSLFSLQETPIVCFSFPRHQNQTFLCEIIILWITRLRNCINWPSLLQIGRPTKQPQLTWGLILLISMTIHRYSRAGKIRIYVQKCTQQQESQIWRKFAKCLAKIRRRFWRKWRFSEISPQV